MMMAMNTITVLRIQQHCSTESFVCLSSRILRSVRVCLTSGKSFVCLASGGQANPNSRLAAYRTPKMLQQQTTATTHDAPTTLISLILIINALSHFGQCQSEPSSNNDTEVIESRSPLFAIDPRLRVSHGNSRGSPRRM